MEKSDKYRWGFCRHCGVLSKYTPKRDLIECLNCGLQDISVIETPYSFKLLIQEMESLGIQIRLTDEELPDEEPPLLFSELYNYKESDTESKPKTKKKSKKTAESEESESEEESDDDLSTVDEEEEVVSDKESELSEMDGGAKKSIENDTTIEIHAPEPELVMPNIAGAATDEDIGTSLLPPIISANPLDFTGNTSSVIADTTPTTNSTLNSDPDEDVNMAKIAEENSAKSNANATSPTGFPIETPNKFDTSFKLPAQEGGTKIIEIKQGGQRLPEPKPQESGDIDDDFFTD
jgi:hypothetical protein